MTTIIVANSITAAFVVLALVAVMRLGHFTAAASTAARAGSRCTRARGPSSARQSAAPPSAGVPGSRDRAPGRSVRCQTDSTEPVCTAVLALVSGHGRAGERC